MIYPGLRSGFMTEENRLMNKKNDDGMDQEEKDVASICNIHNKSIDPLLGGSLYSYSSSSSSAYSKIAGLSTTSSSSALF
jgi:hypothetical protein